MNLYLLNTLLSRLIFPFKVPLNFLVLPPSLDQLAHKRFICLLIKTTLHFYSLFYFYLPLKII